MENDTERKVHLAREVGKQLFGKNIMCPICQEDAPALQQDLATIGDMEENIFCPHCETEFVITCICIG